MSNNKQIFSIAKQYILWRRTLSNVWFLVLIVLTLNAWPDKSSAELRFQPGQYAEYRSTANYSKDESNNTFLDVIYRGTHGLVNMYLNDTPELPEGYIVRETNGYVDIGPKAKKDKWLSFLKTYRGIRITCFLLILLIILIPILALLYCFCCLRCRGPCYTQCRVVQRCCCSWLLLLLLLPFILGIAIAWNANSLIDGALNTTKEIQRNQHTDTCEFLKDTTEQIKHLFKDNFDDLKSHINDQLQNSTYALSDEIESDIETEPLADMKKALDQMPEAKKQMLDVRELIERAKFIAIQFRDALRGVKRSLTYTLFKMCEGTKDCQNFMHVQSIATLDSGCLHYDLAPNSTIFSEEMGKILDSNIKDIPNDVSVQFKEIQKRMREAMKDTRPDIMGHLNIGGDVLDQRVAQITSVMEKAIETLHEDIVIIPSNFNQLKQRLGKGRKTIGYIFISILIIIAICLLIAFALGLMGTLHQWMLVPILLIFLTLSLLLILTLYYFVMGLNLYRGACMGRKANETQQLKRNEIHLKQMMPPDWWQRSDPAPNVSVVEIVKSCSANESIYKIMNLHEILDIESVRDEVVVNVTRDMKKTTGDNATDYLKDVVIMTNEQMTNVTSVLNDSQLSNYSSDEYLKILCKDLVHLSLPTLATNIESLANKLNKVTNDLAIVSLRNNAIHLRAFNEHLYVPLKALIDEIHLKLATIDNLLLVDGKPINDVFTDSVEKAIKAQKKIRDTGKNVTENIGHNITNFVQKEFDRYMHMVLAESHGQIGSCMSVENVEYRRNNRKVCRALVLPFNNLWIGLLLCSLLLLPALYILHKLRCLIKRKNDVVYDDDIEHRPAILPTPLLAPNPAALSGFPLDCSCLSKIDPYNMTKLHPYRIVTIKRPRFGRHHQDLEISGDYMLNKRKVD